MNEPTITLTGNVANDPELSSSAHEQLPVTELRIAVNLRERRGDEWVDGQTLWFSVSIWRTQASRVVEQITKGARVTVAGRIVGLDTFVDRQGVIAATTKIIADDISIALDLRPRADQGRRPAY